MTREGEPNVYGIYIFTPEQARRIKAGDMTAAWEFIEDNRGFLTRWAKKFIRINLAYMPDGYYEADELLDQVYIDLPLYRLDNHNGLRKGIFNSFYGISCGGCSHYYKQRKHYESSLDAPLSVSGRSGDSEDGGTLKDLLPSRKGNRAAVLCGNRESVREERWRSVPRYNRSRFLRVYV